MRNGSPDVAEVGVWLNNVNSVDCEAAPTVSPAPTTENKEIIYVGNPCGESFPLTGLCTECTGDCDYDSDCEGDMRCFQRDGGEDVPGCTFTNSNTKAEDDDYCKFLLSPFILIILSTVSYHGFFERLQTGKIRRNSTICG